MASESMTTNTMQRRTALKALAGTAAFGAALPFAKTASAAELKGRINQSVCLWCYNKYLKQNDMDLDAFAAYCAKLGLKSIDD